MIVKGQPKPLADGRLSSRIVGAMPLDADGAPVAGRMCRRLETASKTMKTGQDGLKFTKMTKNRFLDFVILSSCQHEALNTEKDRAQSIALGYFLLMG